TSATPSAKRKWTPSSTSCCRSAPRCCSRTCAETATAAQTIWPPSLPDPAHRTTTLSCLRSPEHPFVSAGRRCHPSRDCLSGQGEASFHTVHPHRVGPCRQSRRVEGQALLEGLDHL